MNEYLVLQEFKHGRKTYQPGEKVKLWESTAKTRADGGFIETDPVADPVAAPVEAAAETTDVRTVFLSRDITTGPPPQGFKNWHYDAMEAHLVAKCEFDADKPTTIEKVREVSKDGTSRKVVGWNCTQ